MRCLLSEKDSISYSFSFHTTSLLATSANFSLECVWCHLTWIEPVCYWHLLRSINFYIRRGVHNNAKWKADPTVSRAAISPWTNKHRLIPFCLMHCTQKCQVTLKNLPFFQKQPAALCLHFKFVHLPFLLPPPCDEIVSVIMIWIRWEKLLDIYHKAINILNICLHTMSRIKLQRRPYGL